MMFYKKIKNSYRRTFYVELKEDLIFKYLFINMLKIPQNYNEALTYFSEAEFAIDERLHMDRLITFYENKCALYNWNDINEILLKFRKKHETQRVLFKII